MPPELIELASWRFVPRLESRNPFFVASALRASPCCSNSDYKASRVLSLRIAEDLLETLRARAQDAGRSLSGEVVSILRAELESERRPRQKPLPISGWLAHLDVPETHAEFRAARRAASARLLERTSSKSRHR